MPSSGQVLVRVKVEDASGVVVEGPQDIISDVDIAAALVNGRREPYSIATAAFTAFTLPTGARGCIVRLVSGALDCLLTLKGVTGDTGIVLKLAATATLPTLPIVVPVASTAAIGITSATGVSAGVAEVIWF